MIFCRSQAVSGYAVRWEPGWIAPFPTRRPPPGGRPVFLTLPPTSSAPEKQTEPPFLATAGFLIKVKDLCLLRVYKHRPKKRV